MVKLANARSEVVEEIEVARKSPHECTIVRAKVRFQEGGLCYSTYKQAPKGYALSVEKFDREEKPGSGWVSERFILFGSSVGVFLEPATRFSAKRLKELVASVKSRPDYAEMIEKARNLSST